MGCECPVTSSKAVLKCRYRRIGCSQLSEEPERHFDSVATLSKASRSDRLGVVVLGLLGAALGVLLASASDLRLTPALFIIAPGFAAGLAVGIALGPAAGVVACSVSNALAYAAVMCGWYRVALLLRTGFPRWFRSAGVGLARKRSRRNQ